jgi:hypothetical protein
MTVDVEWVAAKQNLLFETGSNAQCNFDRGHVLGADQADRWPAKVLDGNPLNGSCRFSGEALAPEPFDECPFDFRFWPVDRKPQANRSNDEGRGSFNDRIRPESAKLSMADHAGHGSPALAFGQRAAESEPGAVEIGIMLVQNLPVVGHELTEREAPGVD